MKGRRLPMTEHKGNMRKNMCNEYVWYIPLKKTSKEQI